MTILTVVLIVKIGVTRFAVVLPFLVSSREKLNRLLQLTAESSLLTYANYKMHPAMVKQSAKYLLNINGRSQGAFRSRVKLGGARRAYLAGKRLVCRSLLGGFQARP